MPPRRPPAAQPPVITPTDGLRQRQRSDGTWRIWWEPTARQAKLGAKVVDLSNLRGGEAQRRATALTKDYAETTPRLRAHSIDALIADYTASRWFTKLRDSTKGSYRSNMNTIAAKWGPQPVPSFDGPTVNSWYESLLNARGHSRAHSLIIMLQILFKHAERRGWIAKGSNPAADMGMDKPVPQSTRVATDAEIDALLHAADARNPTLALALRLSVHTGQRVEDIRTARPSEFEPAAIPVVGRAKPVQGYYWRMLRSKRGNAGVIPIINAQLVAGLAAQLARADVQAKGQLLLNGNGQPYTRHRLGDHFDVVRAAAAQTLPSIHGLQWRDLRRTFGVRLRIAGVSRDDIGDVLGNTVGISPDLAARYTPATAASTTRAVAAVSLIETPERKKA